MVTQYPDTIFFQSESGESTFVNGIYTPGAPGQSIQQSGRYEPSTLNREILNTDGISVKIKGIFYMPISSNDIAIGSDIEVKDSSGNSIAKTKVLFFTRGQLNCRVYL